MKRIFLWISCLVITSSMMGQNSLLWRVTGNGLKKPSYLFGTMHLKDKRLFNFYDSLLPAIQNTDMLVLELAPDSMSKMVADLIKETKNDISSENGLSKEENEELNRKLEDGLGLNISRRLKARELHKLRRYLYASGMNKSDDKPTFLDAYLCDIARRMGKKLGGLEILEEQKKLLDAFFQSRNEQDDLRKQMNEMKKKDLEAVISMYLKGDLQQIEAHYDDFSEEYVYELLTRRNLKMAHRYDSLVKLNSVFAAIGAAHLPGKSGLINLLRQKGYLVEPVQTTRSGDYQKRIKNLPGYTWKEFKLPENGFACTMPDKPELISIDKSLIDMYMNFDLGTGNVYYVMANAIAAVETEKEQDKRLDAVVNRYENMQQFQVKSKEKGYTLGLRSMNFKLKYKENYEFKVIVMLGKREMYMVMAAYHKNNEHPEDITQFFNSIRLTKKELKGWEQFNNDEAAFEAQFPGKVQKSVLKNKLFEKEVNINLYKSTDNVGNSYIVKYYDMPEGYHIGNDQLTFNEFVTNIEQAAKPENKLIIDTLIDQMPAQQVYFGFRDETAMNVINVIRGQRLYTLINMMLNKDTTNNYSLFFNSFHLKNYKHSPLQTYYITDSLIRVRLPVKPNLHSQDTSENDKSIFYQYTLQDKNTGHTYYLQNTILDKYSSYKNDTALLKEALDRFKGDDTVFSSALSKKGNVYTGEYVLKTKETKSYERIKILIKGREVYALFAYLPSTVEHQEDVDSIFNSFHFNKEVIPFNPFESKSKLLLKTLLSKDTNEVRMAGNGIKYCDMKVEDIPLLKQAMLNKFPDDTIYQNTRVKLLRNWAEMKDTSLISFAIKHQNEFKKTNNSLYSETFQVIRNFKTKAAYTELKKLFLNNADTSFSSYFLFYSMRDSLELAKILYPEILSLVEKHELPGLLYLTVCLLDSGIINKEMVQPYQSIFQNVLEKNIKSLSDDDEQYLDANLIDLVSRTTEEIYSPFMQKIIDRKNNWNTANAIYSAIRRNYKVDPKAIKRLAGLPAIRLDLYKELAKAGKTTLLPKQYSTRRALAESELYSLIEAEYEYPVKKLEYMQELVRDSSGIPQKFLLFEVKYSEKEMKNMIAISGPYPMNNENILTTNATYSGLMEGEKDKNKLRELLEEHCNQIDEYSRKAEKL